MAQAFGALEVSVNLGFGFVGQGKSPVDFGDDLLLFGSGREWNWECTQAPLAPKDALDQRAALLHAATARRGSYEA